MARNEATGAVADLFAENVGFYAGWGFCRSITRVDNRFSNRRGNLDWFRLDLAVGATLAEQLGSLESDDGGVPGGICSMGVRLYGGVAVSQRVSAWHRAGRSRALLALRCNVGKRTVRGCRQNLVLLQYRVWQKDARGQVVRQRRVAQARRVFSALHRKIIATIGGEAQ